MIAVPHKVRPSTFYKYCPPERIDILENLEVRFSSPSDFNDFLTPGIRFPPTPEFHFKNCGTGTNSGID